MMSDPATIVMQGESVAELKALSVTRTVKQNVPAVVGVPVMQPVEAPRDVPGGTDPESRLNV